MGDGVGQPRHDSAIGELQGDTGWARLRHLNILNYCDEAGGGEHLVTWSKLTDLLAVLSLLLLGRPDEDQVKGDDYADGNYERELCFVHFWFAPGAAGCRHWASSLRA